MTTPHTTYSVQIDDGNTRSENVHYSSRHHQQHPHHAIELQVPIEVPASAAERQYYANNNHHSRNNVDDFSFQLPDSYDEDEEDTRDIMNEINNSEDYYHHPNQNRDNIIPEQPRGRSQKYSYTYTPCARHFLMSLGSNIMFVLASCFYVALAGYDLESEMLMRDVSDDVLLADDDWTWEQAGLSHLEDDYIFVVGSEEEGTWVSQYQILYFCGALCFVWSGMLDFLNEPGYLGIVLVMAGCFGLISAMLVEKNEYMADVFNAVSVHLFLVEAIGLFFHRPSQQDNIGGLQTYIRLGDVFFILGSLIDAVLSYFFVLESAMEKTTHVHSQAAVFAATCWLACSLIYITATSHVECQGRQQWRRMQQQQQQRRQQQVDISKSIRAPSSETRSTQGGNYSSEDSD